MTSIWEAEELARHLCGLPEDEDDDEELESGLLDKFDVDFLQFATIADALLPLCVCGTSALTGKAYQGFGKDGTFMMKREMAQPKGGKER